jgi:fimbrial isopeptide formation D2 family protein/uncharacterized repeat protein (TIGR01451 family)
VVPSQGATSPPYSVQPGDRVTYRLTYTVPLSSFEQLRLIDLPPLPVMDVTAQGGFTFVRNPAAYTFAPGQVGVLDAAGNNATDDTYFATFDPGLTGGRNPTVTADGTTNSVTMDFGSQDDPARRSTQISLLITFQVSADPFVADLFLTNQLRVSEGSTNAGDTTVEDLRRFQLVRPFVTVQKGAVAGGGTGLSAGGVAFAPATNPTGTFTIGGAAVSAANALDSAAEATAVGGLNVTPSNAPVDAGDTVRYAIVLQNTDKGDAFDVSVTDQVQPGYVVPGTAAGLNLRVFRGDGTPLALGTDYTLSYNSATGRFTVTLTDNYTAGNVGGAAEDARSGALSRGLRTDQSTGDVAITNGSNTVVILYDLTLAGSVAPNQQIVNTADVTNYSNEDGGADLTDPAVVPGATDPTDTATVTVRLPGQQKTLVGTEVSGPGNNAANQATIGELVTYDVVVTLPEGTTLSADLLDTLANGLAFVDIVDVQVSSGALTFSTGLSSAGNGAANVATLAGNTAVSAVGGQAGRQVRFTLGDIVNTDTDNSTAETIRIRYRVVVLDTNGAAGSANNQAGATRNNSAQFRWLNNAATLPAVAAGQSSGAGGTRTGTATPVTVVEPTLTTTKVVANLTDGTGPAAKVHGDAGDAIRYTITVANPAAGSATAFDVTLSDAVPTTLTGVTIVSAGSTGTLRFGGVTRAITAADLLLTGNTLTLAAGTDLDIDPGATITIVLDGTFSGATGSVVPNVAETRWTSLDGDQTAARSAFNTASVERTGADGLLGGGTLNDYRTQGRADVESPPLVRKTVVTTSEAGTVGTNVAVGEIVRYRLMVSLAEGVTPDFQINDRLPAGLRFLNDGTARYAFVTTGGAGIASAGITNIPGLANAGVNGNEATLAGLLSSAVTGVFADGNVAPTAGGAGTGEAAVYATGQGVFFRFGDLTNTDRDTDNEFVVVEFNALVANEAGNQAGTTLNNTLAVLVDTDASGTPGYVSVVQDLNGDGLSDAGDATATANDPANDGTGTPGLSAPAAVTVVEPNMTVAKSVAATTGSTVTYKLVVTNTGTATGFDARVLDALNAAQLGLVGGSVAVSLAGGAAGATDNTAGNTVDVTIASVPVGGTVTITYTATVLATPTGASTIDNTATVTDTSLPGPAGTGGAWTGTAGTSSAVPGAAGTAIGERTGQDGVGGALNDYAATAGASLGSLGDRVWFDADGDGVQDAGEPGIVGAGVTVRWAGPDGAFNTADDSVITTTTGADGVYTVTGLPVDSPGAFRVTVDATGGPFAAFGLTAQTFDATAPATDSRSQVALTTATTPNPRTQDFGYRGTATLGDRVYLDLNGDGVQQANEPGVPQARVTLVWAGQDGLFGTADDYTYPTPAVTDSNGNYQFANLPAGLFRATVDLASLPGGVASTDSVDDGTLSPGSTVDVSMTPGQTRTDVDFGFRGTGTVGDTVWYDVNGDQVRQAGPAVFEPGIGGVTVTLVYGGRDGDLATAADNITITGTTDANGSYLFAGLPGGDFVNGTAANYRVTVGGAALAGYPARTFDADGTGTADTSALRLAAGGTDLGQDFGYRGPATQGLGDFVWEDLDGNGRQDAGEPGIEGVAVRLVGAGADGTLGTADDVVIAQTQTDAAGKYSLPSLAAGSYRVRFDGTAKGVTYARTVRASAVAAPGTDSDADVATGETGNVSVSAGAVNGTVDAGLYRPVSLGDLVWYDRNANGVQDGGEPGVPNATVTAVWFGPDAQPGGGDDVTFSTTTGADGSWTIGNLPPGTYRVTVTGLPAGVVPTYDLDSGTAGADDTTLITLVSNAPRTDADFGVRGTGTVGDRVFLDVNGNGLYDPGEGLDGVTVRLAGDLNGDGAVGPGETLTAVTAADGFYLFTGLRAAAGGVTYTVTVDPAGLPRDGAGNPLPNTADPDAGSANTSAVALTAARPADDLQDFGYRGPGRIGDTVFLDANGNGAFDPGEGVTGVGVTLAGDVDGDGTAETYTARTDAAGRYLFDGLPVRTPGGALITYTVTVTAADLPAGVANVVDPDGGNDGTSMLQLVPANPVDLAQDFGYTAGNSLGDEVFLDLNGNGLFDPGEGLTGVTVRLTADVNGDGVSETFVAVTGADGGYLFANLPGKRQDNTTITYTVTVDAASLPAGLANTADPDGVTDGTWTGDVVSAPNRRDIDFGYRGTGSLGDRVWLDANGDGKQDAAAIEPGLPAAGVGLVWAGQDGVFGTADDVTTAAVTDAAGQYLFTGLPAGTYRVTVAAGTLPADVAPTFDRDGTATANTADRTLALGEAATDADFGYRGTGSLGDLVWYDVDGNGVQNNAEPGVAGATVTVVYAGPDAVFGSADDVTFTATTGADGKYLLAGLPGGAYRATVTARPAIFTAPTFDLDGTATADTATFALATGQARRDVDFGYRGTASLGDFAWEDRNGNGVQDAGEPGVGGVGVELLDGAGNVLATTTTATGTGAYTFPGLAAGTYRVRFAAPAGYAVTAAGLGGDPARDSDADPATRTTGPVTLATGEVNPRVDVGLFRPVAIGDRVWIDTNGDGRQDATNEPGIVVATVTLLYAGPDGAFGTADDATVTTTTGADGAYLFPGRAPGHYRVTVSGLPNGLTAPTFDLDGVGSPNAATLSAVSGTDRLDADFGYRGVGSLGDRVWYDLDRDGTDAAEPGIAGVRVTAVFAGQDGRLDTAADNILYTLTTDANGFYDFADLPLGVYLVTVDTTTLPPDLLPTFDLDGGTANPDNAAAYTLTPAAPTTTVVDFGYTGRRSVGDRVWVDFNGDGRQDADEPGIPGVQLALTWAGPDGRLGTADDARLRTVTGADGKYLFAHVPPGLVGVTITGGLPAGTVPTADLDGTADNATSLTLGLADARTDVDFGVRGTARVTGAVYRDDSNDGVRQPGEPGFAGIPVTLTGTDVTGTPVRRATVTDANGDYAFAGLLPGTYVVTQMANPADTADGKDAAGTVDGRPDGAAGNDVIRQIVLGPGQAAVANDFGELAGLVAGTVFVDADRDGRLGPTEARLANVRIDLVDAAGTVVRTTTTDANGDYLIRGFAPGRYTVRETQPLGYGDTTPNERLVDVPPLGVTGILFGERTGTVGGSVYRDLSVDGVRGNAAGETGIGGVLVTLTGTDALGTPVRRTQTTDREGHYLFAGLLAGAYRVQEGTPAGFYYDGLDTFGNLGGTAANDDLRQALPPGGDATDYNFGENPPADPFGYVYVDANENGVRDPGEPGIGGVPVTIRGTAFAGTAMARPLAAADLPGGSLTAVTDPTGRWEFAVMPPGVYSVTEDVQPAGLLDGAEQNGDPGSPAPAMGNDRFDGLVLAPTPIRGPFNFGEIEPDPTKRRFLASTSAAAGNQTAPRPDVPMSPSFAVTTGTPDRPAFVVTAAGAGYGPTVRVFDYATGGERFRFQAYEPWFTGGVRTATGDVDGDGTPDVVTATGVGGGPRVRVFSGADGHVIRDFFAYEAEFRGGVFVAAGDVTGDGVADIVTGTEVGGGPRVRVFDGATGAVVRDFFAFDADQRGGVRVAVSADAAGRPELVAATGEGVPTRVRVFDTAGTVVREIAPYGGGFAGGVSVAAGDVTGDGVPDIVTGAEVGGGPHVQVFDGATGAVVRSLFAGDAADRTGVRVAVRDVDGDGVGEIVAAPAGNASARVRVLKAATGQELDTFWALDPSYIGGVYVG